MLTKARIQQIKSLADKRSRAEHGMFMVEGRKMVDEALSSGFGIESIYSTSERDGAERVTTKEMDRMSHLKTPSDTLALVRIPARKALANAGERLTLMLDNVQDPGNMGTIIRLADWFGIRDVVCSPTTADCYAPKVVQATMGAIFRVRIHYTLLEAVLHDAVQAGVPVYGTFLEGRNIYETTLADRGILVMGSEGKGVSESVAKLVTDKLYIPPYPAAGGERSESLNVAVAAAIACAEFRRQSVL